MTRSIEDVITINYNFLSLNNLICISTTSIIITFPTNFQFQKLKKTYMKEKNIVQSHVKIKHHICTLIVFKANYTKRMRKVSTFILLLLHII